MKRNKNGLITMLTKHERNIFFFNVYIRNKGYEMTAVYTPSKRDENAVYYRFYIVEDEHPQMIFAMDYDVDINSIDELLEKALEGIEKNLEPFLQALGEIDSPYEI